MTEPHERRGVSEVDTTKPSIARVYDALLGGKDNYGVDRNVAAHVTEVTPDIGDLAWQNRAVLGRGVNYLADKAGIRQFIDLGSGLPTVENTHQVAQHHIPDARVVYVDIDPIVLAHGRALLVENDWTTVVTADLREPESIIDNPHVRELIDFSEPVGILLVGMLHHLHDNEGPQDIVAAYMNAVSPGSHLFVTHFCRSGADVAELEKAFLHSLGSGRFRTREEIAHYFAGLELVEPGLVYLPEWRPEKLLSYPLSALERLMVGGIGRKP